MYLPHHKPECIAVITIIFIAVISVTIIATAGTNIVVADRGFLHLVWEFSRDVCFFFTHLQQGILQQGILLDQCRQQFSHGKHVVFPI